MTINIIKRTFHRKGTLFTFIKESKKVDILFMAHAMQRIEKWQLSIEIVAETLLDPQEVIVGHNNRFIAQRCFGLHILRAIYEYEKSIPALVTVYFPYKSRYFQGGGCFEDKILKRG